MTDDEKTERLANFVEEVLNETSVTAKARGYVGMRLPIENVVALLAVLQCQNLDEPCTCGSPNCEVTTVRLQLLHAGCFQAIDVFLEHYDQCKNAQEPVYVPLTFDPSKVH